MRHREGRFTGEGNLELYYQCWYPAREVRAVVGIVPGLGSHSGLFGGLVEGLLAAGYGTYSVDLRGHGQSPGQRGHIDRWKDLCGDVGRFWQLMSADNPGLPCFLLGHSLGATVVLDYALQRSDGVTGVIAIAPAIGPIGVSPIKMGIGRAFSTVWPRFSLDTGLPEDAGSRCPEWIAAYANDPLRHRRGTARLAAEFLGAAKRLQAELLKLEVPLLILQGSEDSVVQPEATRQLFSQITLIDKEYREYPGGLHDLHNDICARQVSLDIVSWVNRHVEGRGLLCELIYYP
ncbi:MAG: alpha/beta hydrolase [Cyanobacteria bacterium Co-bin13]|nr:alpha/beta hydrolase [Cyanobacteria bacterium Co-bin13]